MPSTPPGLQIAISASPLATALIEPGASLAKKRGRHFVSPCGRIRIITCLSRHSFAATSSEVVSSISRERIMTGRLIGIGMVSMTGVSSAGSGRRWPPHISVQVRKARRRLTQGGGPRRISSLDGGTGVMHDALPFDCVGRDESGEFGGCHGQRIDEDRFELLFVVGVIADRAGIEV